MSAPGSPDPFEPPDYVADAIDRLDSALDKVFGPVAYGFVLHAWRDATYPGLWASTPIETFPLTAELVWSLEGAGCSWWGAHPCTITLTAPTPVESPVCELSCRLALGPRHATRPDEYNLAYCVITPATVAGAGLPIVCRERPRGWPAFSFPPECPF